MYHDVFQTFQAFCRVESAPARKCAVGFCWFLFLGFSVRSRHSRRSQGPDFAGHSRASATRCRNLSGRLLIFHVTQEVISADPGRRKGERVREKDVLHCYYFYYYYYYDYDYDYDYYYYYFFFVLHRHGVSGWRVRRFGGSEGVS